MAAKTYLLTGRDDQRAGWAPMTRIIGVYILIAVMARGAGLVGFMPGHFMFNRGNTKETRQVAAAFNKLIFLHHAPSLGERVINVVQSAVVTVRLCKTL